MSLNTSSLVSFIATLVPADGAHDENYKANKNQYSSSKHWKNIMATSIRKLHIVNGIVISHLVIITLHFLNYSVTSSHAKYKSFEMHEMYFFQTRVGTAR